MGIEYPGAAEGRSAPELENAAWASVEVPLSPQRLHDFLADTGRLFRLNPHLEIEAWLPQDAGTRTYRWSALNETNGCRSEVCMRAEALVENAGWTLHYDAGLKRATEFRIAAAAGGSLLTVTDHYHPVPNGSDERLKEVDRSLIPWTGAIRRHLAGLARFGGMPGYRWWMECVMLGMPPRQRRIVRMIVWVSVLEFVVFLFVALIYVLESGRS